MDSPVADTTFPESEYAKSCAGTDLDEPARVQEIIASLNLQKHPEGGYFVETDRDERTVPNPFQKDPSSVSASSNESGPTRNASTTIFYLVSPGSPVGHFHRNKGRTVHTIHSGRGVYVLIHADQFDKRSGTQAPMESFVVGHDLGKGERLQWIVDGGKFKASYLLPDSGSDTSQGGLLISETVIPGFDFADHDFLTAEAMKSMVKPAHVEELVWLLKREERMKLEQK